jgi:hypothetical protein
VRGESEADYVNRITVTLRDTNTHFVSGSTSHDYVPSDNTHPTYTARLSTLAFSAARAPVRVRPDYSGAQMVSGKNPVWNRFGHERMGWAISAFNPATP